MQLTLKVSAATVGPVLAVSVTVPEEHAADTPMASTVAPVPNGLEKQIELLVQLVQAQVHVVPDEDIEQPPWLQTH